MHTSWWSYPICFWILVVFIWYLIPMTCLFGRQTFFVLSLCAIMKSVEGLVYYLMLFSSIGFLLSFGIFSKWFLQSCVDLGLWYNLDNSFSCRTCVCFLGLIGVFVQLVSHLVLESIVHAYLLYVYLMACLLLIDQIYRINSIKS